MNIKITLTTLSPLISASGESSAHIDADVKYDEYGFPYVQARTFKGLLRESATEVCEIMGYDEKTVKEKMTLFGNTGRETGSLQFNNLYIQDYEKIIAELKANPTALRPDFVKSHYTEFRRQTTIDKKSGTALDKSLRTYRLIKEAIIFETVIENVSDTEFMQKVFANLRYMGSRRNRGFGKIKVEKIGEVISIPKIHIEINTNGSGTIQCLSFSIKTLDTLLISKVIGDQNTVHTEHFIPAQNIRGLVANLISFNGKAHKDALFKRLILGDVKYGHAFLEGTMPIPRILGYDKTDNETKIYQVLSSTVPLKGLKGFAEIHQGTFTQREVKTSFSFHSSRKDDRLAGRSTEAKGAIFYYEAIETVQIFTGKIMGNSQDLQEIQRLLSQNNGQHRMGKSKTAQYSKVQFEKLNIDDFGGKQVGKSPLYLVFQSPVITYNEYGMAIPNISILENELKEILGITIEKIESVSNFVQTESYMGIWQTKTPREAAFDIGTTLKITFEGDISASTLQKIEMTGLGERKNEGFGNIKWMTIGTELTRKDAIISPSEKQSFTHHSLIEMLAKQQEEKTLGKTKENAIDAIKPYINKIPNALISKLKDELMSRDRDNWVSFVKTLENKKAGKTLKESYLWEKIIETQESKEYWLTFFKALRTKNNQVN